MWRWCFVIRRCYFIIWRLLKIIWRWCFLYENDALLCVDSVFIWCCFLMWRCFFNVKVVLFYMKMVLFYMMVLFFFIKGCFLMWTWALGTSFIFEYWVFHLLCRHVGINTKICCDQNPFDTQVYNLTRWSVYDFSSTELTSIKWPLYKDGILQKLKLSNVMLNFEERKIEIINYLCLSEERVIRWDINALAIWLKPDLWSVLNFVIVTA